MFHEHMLDIKLIRQNPKLVKDGIKKKGTKPGLVDEILELDEKKRKVLQEIEGLRAEQNKLGKGDIKKGKEIKVKIKKLEPELEKTDKELVEMLLALPNLPLKEVPLGGEEDSVVL